MTYEGNKGHRGYVRGVGVLHGPLGARIVSCGYDGQLIAWTIDLEPVAHVLAHAGGVGTLAVCADGRVATGGGDGRVRVWSCERDAFRLEGEHPLPEARTTPLVETLRWSHDGATLAAGSVEGRLFLLERGALREVEHPGGFLSINAVRFTDDDRHLLVASDHCRVHVYRRADLALVDELGAFDDHVDGLAVLPGPRGTSRVLAVTHGPAVWGFDLVGEPPRARGLERVTAGRFALNALSPVACAGGRVVVGGDERTVYEVAADLSSVTPIARVPRDIDDLAPVDADLVAVATTCGLHLVSTSGRRVVRSRQNHGALAAVTVVGGRVIVGAHDHPRLYARAADGSDGGERSYPVSAPVSCAAPAAAVFGLADGAIVRLRGHEVVELARAPGEVEAVWASDGCDAPRVVAVDRMGIATIVTARGVRSVPVSRFGDRLKAVIPCPWRPGCFLAAGKDRALYLIDPIAASAEVVRWDHRAGRTFNALATARGLVFGASWDGRIHVGRVGPDGDVQSLRTLDGHTHAVEALVVLGDRLVSTSYDGTLRTWDLATLDGAGCVNLSEMAVRRQCAAEGDDRVWSAGYDGRARYVDVVRGAVLATWEVTP